VSTEESTTVVDDDDDDEDSDQDGIDRDGLEAGNDTEEEFEEEKEYTASFGAEDCTFTAAGRNPFFILEPNYQLVLSGDDSGETAIQMITVLNETREVNGTETRVVEERSTVDGDLAEISRNLFAVCEETNSVFYFGEDVDFYENNTIVSHEGEWIAGEGNNKPGIIMHGTVLLGARYYQEIAPDVAIGEAEVIDMGEVVQTGVGNFTDTITIRETTPLEPDVVGLKNYAAEVGIIQEGELKLERYGFIEE
jgi:hypothetical protein